MGLFRGKRIDNGEWVEGFFIVGTDCVFPGRAFICERIYVAFDDDDELTLGGFIEVDPDTISECTSRKDKNGKLIFEGEWVEIRYCDHTGEEYVSRRTVSYNPEHGRWYPLCWGEECDFCDAYTEITSIEVIDNPELLEDGESE